MTQFNQYPLCEQLLLSLKNLNFTEATSTQEACLPTLLQGKDALVEAKTGSGKTLAFGLAVLDKLALQSQAAAHPQALVLCPTRELVEQVSYQLQLLARQLANTKILALFGGVALAPQLNSLRHAPAVVVGTPGRVIDIINHERLDLSGVKTLVLDEADRMLDMGFSEQVDWIIRKLHNQASEVQTLLFSATFGDNINSLSERYQRNAEVIKVTDADSSLSIEQSAYKTQSKMRNYTVAALLTEYQPESTIVFCQTKVEVNALTQQLSEDGFSVVQLQGDMEQSERTNSINLFSANCANVLVATDVASRGLDIANVSMVINHRISDDLDIHTHRIGRTGRAGESGKAITIIDDEDEHKLIKFNAQLPEDIPIKHAQSLRFHANRIISAKYIGIQIDAGKKRKVSKGDLLGALTKQANIPAKDIGKIHISRYWSFAAIKIRSVKRALMLFREESVKGKRVRAKKL